MTSEAATAKVLCERYYEVLYKKVLDILDRMTLAKQCAIIAVEEMIEAYENCTAKDSVIFYQKVKQEIKKI